MQTKTTVGTTNAYQNMYGSRLCISRAGKTAEGNGALTSSWVSDAIAILKRSHDSFM